MSNVCLSRQPPGICLVRPGQHLSAQLSFPDTAPFSSSPKAQSVPSCQSARLSLSLSHFAHLSFAMSHEEFGPGLTSEDVESLVEHETFANSPLVPGFPSATTLTHDEAESLIALRDVCANALLAMRNPNAYHACQEALSRSSRYRAIVARRSNSRDPFDLAGAKGFLSMFTGTANYRHDIGAVSQFSSFLTSPNLTLPPTDDAQAKSGSVRRFKRLDPS